MLPNAVTQAQTHLDRAIKALSDLKIAASYEESETAWANFLAAASGIFAKLEQGSKKTKIRKPGLVK